VRSPKKKLCALLPFVLACLASAAPQNSCNNLDHLKNLSQVNLTWTLVDLKRLRDVLLVTVKKTVTRVQGRTVPVLASSSLILFTVSVEEFRPLRQTERRREKG
jgi:hypothetical protein